MGQCGASHGHYGHRGDGGTSSREFPPRGGRPHPAGICVYPAVCGHGHIADGGLSALGHSIVQYIKVLGEGGYLQCGFNI